MPDAPSPRRFGGALAVGAGIFLSRIAGLARDRAISHYLGLSPAAGVFRAALRIPNLLQNLLGEGVLSGSFIPVYARLMAEGRHEDAARVARAIGTLLALVASAVALLGVVLAEPLVDLLDQPGSQQLHGDGVREFGVPGEQVGQRGQPRLHGLGDPRRVLRTGDGQQGVDGAERGAGAVAQHPAWLEQRAVEVGRDQPDHRPIIGQGSPCARVSG